MLTRGALAAAGRLARTTGVILPAWKRAWAASRATRSSESKPGGPRNRASSERPFTERASTVQVQAPSAPSARANPVIPESAMSVAARPSDGLRLVFKCAPAFHVLLMLLQRGGEIVPTL